MYVDIQYFKIKKRKEKIEIQSEMGKQKKKKVSDFLKPYNCVLIMYQILSTDLCIQTLATIQFLSEMIIKGRSIQTSSTFHSHISLL